MKVPVSHPLKIHSLQAFTWNNTSIIKAYIRQMAAQLCSLQWRHNGCDGVSNHQLDCLLNCLSRRRSKKTSKLHVNGLCEGNSPVIGEFPEQMASNTKMFPFDDVIMLYSCTVIRYHAAVSFYHSTLLRFLPEASFDCIYLCVRCALTNTKL